MKAINGQVPVWSGSIHYGDVDITDSSVLDIIEEGVVTLPQEGGVLGTLTVEENLELGARNVLKDDERIERNKKRVLDEFPVLEEKLDDPAGSLSGGQQMMVSFGRAMMTEADVYLLDEPTAGLAPSLVNNVLDLVNVLVDDGAQVMLVEQNVKAALKVADYVYILSQGKVHFEGTPGELTDDEELMDIYLGL
jgi:branched-chain amino acid transport system ATP-binding protein